MGKKKQQRKLTERMHHNSDTVRFAIGTNVICAFPDYFEEIESDDGFNYERKIVTKFENECVYGGKEINAIIQVKSSGLVILSSTTMVKSVGKVVSKAKKKTK